MATYGVTNAFASQSGNVPPSQLDTNNTDLLTGINNAYLVGTLAARPAADGIGKGRYYYATDVQILYRDNGSAWVQIAASALTIAGIPSIAAGGTADAITATYSPVITLADQQFAAFVATAANATTTPTFAPNGLTAHTITKKGGAALAVGDIPGANAVCLLQYNLTNTRWELLNPATVGVALSSKVVQVSFDMSSASGSLAITGAGFKPTAAVILASVEGASQASWGMIDSAGNNKGFKDDNGVTTDTYSASAFAFDLRASAGNSQTGTWASWDADGLTLTRTKTGTPTGTAYLSIIFFK